MLTLDRLITKLQSIRNDPDAPYGCRGEMPIVVRDTYWDECLVNNVTLSCEKGSFYRCDGTFAGINNNRCKRTREVLMINFDLGGRLDD
jgi:hypothetical protein